MKNNEELKKHHCDCEECHCDEHKDNCECGDCHCDDECTCHGREQEYLELAQRIKAEFDNYKRRNADLTTQSFNNGVGTLVFKLLPAIDSFKQARVNIKDEDTLKGLDMIQGLIFKAFQELNVEKIECVGQEFDPRYHNAVLTGQDENQPDNVVLEEYQEGFKLNDRIIRPSVVKINKLS